MKVLLKLMPRLAQTLESMLPCRVFHLARLIDVGFSFYWQCEYTLNSVVSHMWQSKCT